MMDALHRALTGQTITARELRFGGILILLWFLMDLSQWLDWLFSRAPACGGS